MAEQSGELDLFLAVAISVGLSSYQSQQSSSLCFG